MAPRPLRSVPVTIPNGTAIMAAGVDIRGGELVGIVMPATWTPASITFQASGDGTNYFDVFDDGGTELSLTVAASRAVGLTDAKQKVLRGIRNLKVRSGPTAAPVNQGADRILTLLLAG